MGKYYIYKINNCGLELTFDVKGYTNPTQTLTPINEFYSRFGYSVRFVVLNYLIKEKEHNNESVSDNS